MERVLDAPVLPYRLGEPHALRWQGREKIPRLDLHRVPHFTMGLDHAHAVQVRPRGLGAKPLNLRRDPIPTRFNATVIPIDGFVVGVRDVRKPRVPGIVEKQRHRLGERRVIVLERQDILCSLLCNSLGDLFLTPHRINRDYRSCEVQQVEELGNGDNFVGFLLDFPLPSHQPVGTRPGTHHMDGSRGGRLIERMAERFAIDRHNITPGGLAEGPGPRDEALGQFFGVQLR